MDIYINILEILYGISLNFQDMALQGQNIYLDILKS